MVVAFNETTVAAQPVDQGLIRRQELLTDRCVKGTPVLLDRLTLAAGSSARFDIPANSLAWLQLLDGEATLESPQYAHRMSDSESVYLPPAFKATLSASKGATLLCARIPDAARIDPDISTSLPLFMVIDWMREAVFVYERDARKRVPLVNPEISGTTAIKVDMVIHPPGSSAPNHHHEGADSFMYILDGSGITWADEQPFPVRPGDLIHFPDRERHALKASDSCEMRFLEFYVPGKYKTVWADPSRVGVWRSTGHDIHGGETAANERKRLSGRFTGWVDSP